MTDRQSRIFLSYASERGELAADVAAALRAEGHAVFFDRSSLAAGEGYDERIRAEIADADLFVILLSAEVFRENSYVRTELRFAKQTWASPVGRVLPVAILPLDRRKLDPFLRRITLLYPEGDVAAEVAARVHELIHGRAAVPVPGAARPDVAPRQLNAYRTLWKLTGALPKWGREETPTYATLEALGRALRKWYFERAGGLFLTRRSYSRYAALQNALESVRPAALTDPLSAEDHEEVRELCSALRHQLAEDLGTRT